MGWTSWRMHLDHHLSSLEAHRCHGLVGKLLMICHSPLRQLHTRTFKICCQRRVVKHDCLHSPICYLCLRQSIPMITATREKRERESTSNKNQSKAEELKTTKEVQSMKSILLDSFRYCQARVGGFNRRHHQLLPHPLWFSRTYQRANDLLCI